MENKNVIITGANSFIGSYFVKHIPEFNVTEICMKKNEPKDIDFSGIDVVFHVAAIVHQNKKIPSEIYYKVNSELTFEIAKKAKKDGVSQFVFMSTVKVYGENNSKEKPWSENSECFPMDDYGKSKLDAEIRLKTLNDKDFIVSIIRTPVVYGVNVKGNIQRIARFIKRVRVVPLNGINNKRAMVYIGNLVTLIKEVIKQKQGGLFLAGDSHVISTSEFVQYLIECVDKRRIFIKIPHIFQIIIKIIYPNIYNRLFGSILIDNKITFNRLNYSPPFTIKEGIQEVMDSI